MMYKLLAQHSGSKQVFHSEPRVPEETVINISYTIYKLYITNMYEQTTLNSYCKHILQTRNKLLSGRAHLNTDRTEWVKCAVV